VIFAQPFGTAMVQHSEKQCRSLSKQHIMKALVHTLVASALLSAVFAQAPEREDGPPPERRGPHGPPPKEILEKFDKDGDGKLNEEEREAMHKAMKARHEEEMLKRFDKDGDGKLSEEERKAMEEERKKRMGEREKELLKRFDKNGDGILDEEEKKAAREARREHGPKRPERPRD
jgi:hypothetical protein